MRKRTNFPFFHQLRVRYAEVDAQAVVYNAHYVTYFDIAITEFLRTLDFDYSVAAMRASGNDFHTVRVAIDYRQPAYYDDLLDIGVQVTRIGRTSITWTLAIFRQVEGSVPVTEGEVIWVYADQHEHRSTPLPPALSAELQRLGSMASS